MGESKRREDAEDAELRDYYAGIGPELDLFLEACQTAVAKKICAPASQESVISAWNTAATGLAAMVQRDGVSSAIDDLPAANAEIIAREIARAASPVSFVRPKP